jgi:hypothetical protein
MILTLVLSIFFWVGMYGIHSIFDARDPSFRVNYIVLLQPLYNTLIAPPLFMMGRAIFGVCGYNGGR